MGLRARTAHHSKVIRRGKPRITRMGADKDLRNPRYPRYPRLKIRFSICAFRISTIRGGSPNERPSTISKVRPWPSYVFIVLHYPSTGLEPARIKTSIIRWASAGWICTHWFFSDAHFSKIRHGEGDGMTGVDNDFAERGFDRIGASILGRNVMFGADSRAPGRMSNGRAGGGDNPPYHTPVFVSHSLSTRVDSNGGQN